MTAAVFAASVVTATASFHLVERPAMRLRPWLGRAPVDPGADAPRAVRRPAVTGPATPWATEAEDPAAPAAPTGAGGPDIGAGSRADGPPGWKRERETA